MSKEGFFSRFSAYNAYNPLNFLYVGENDMGDKCALCHAVRSFLQGVGILTDFVYLGKIS